MGYKEGLRVTIGSFSHATEDEEKVKRAMINLISFEPPAPNIKRLYGHWGNPILSIEYELYDKDAELFLKNLFMKIGNTNSEQFMDFLIERMDEKGRIHLRFDKQRAYKGEIVYSSFDDIIKVIISISGDKKKFLNKIMNSI